jgi:hypothetical protein
METEILVEGMSRKQFQAVLDPFITFAINKLGIKEAPAFRCKPEDDQGEQPSFGGYAPSSNSIIVSTKNRHPLDVLRTIAHELVHHKQNEQGRIKDVAKEGSTGSKIENEANAVAGQLMRLWGKSNPSHFNLPHIKEQVLTEVGGAGNFGTSKLRRRYQKDTPGQKLKTFTSDSITGSAKSGPGAASNSMSDNGSVPYAGLSEPVSVWTCKEEVRQRFFEKYGPEGETRLLRVALNLSEMDFDASPGGVSDSSAKDEVKPDTNAEFEKTSLLKRIKKARSTKS